MRAAVLRQVGEPLEVRDDVELCDPGPGDVRVRLAASGVCHSDLSVQDGTIMSPLPCVPGHEGAGEVIAVGEGVQGLGEGDHVILSWVPPCGRCRYCLAGQANLCTELMMRTMAPGRLSVSGEALFTGMGTATFAEETVVPAAAAIRIPRDVPLDIAALLGCGVMTGVGAAINTARVEPGSAVAVIGCGGVGINVIQGARIAGAATVAAIDPVDQKLDWAKSFGATHTAHPKDLASLSGSLTKGHGFDYVFEVVGRSATIRQAWDATRRGGTTVVVGAGRPDDPVSFSALELFALSKSLVGCMYGGADVRTDFNRLLDLWRGGQLELDGLITRRIDLGEVNDAFAAMQDGEVIRTLIEF